MVNHPPPFSEKAGPERVRLFCLVDRTRTGSVGIALQESACLRRTVLHLALLLWLSLLTRWLVEVLHSFSFDNSVAVVVRATTAHHHRVSTKLHTGLAQLGDGIADGRIGPAWLVALGGNHTYDLVWSCRIAVENLDHAVGCRRCRHANRSVVVDLCGATRREPGQSKDDRELPHKIPLKYPRTQYAVVEASRDAQLTDGTKCLRPVCCAKLFWGCHERVER